jgi:WD40 repeat protein
MRLHCMTDCWLLSLVFVFVCDAWIELNDVFTAPNNFLKGVKFSPDGTCLLTCSEDHVLRVFNLPSHTLTPLSSSALSTTDSEHSGASSSSAASSLATLQAALSVSEGDTIYDYVWNPQLSSSSADRSSAFFVSTSRDHPIHLFDAWDGTLRASYVAYNTVDEPTAAISVAMSPDGTKVLGGFERCVRVWDVSRPGREVPPHYESAVVCVFDCTAISYHIISYHNHNHNHIRSTHHSLYPIRCCLCVV